MQKEYSAGDLCFASKQFYSLGSLGELYFDPTGADTASMHSEKTGRLFMFLKTFYFEENRTKVTEEGIAYIVYSFKARTVGWVFPHELQKEK